MAKSNNFRGQTNSTTTTTLGHNHDLVLAPPRRKGRSVLCNSLYQNTHPPPPANMFSIVPGYCACKALTECLSVSSFHRLCGDASNMYCRNSCFAGQSAWNPLSADSQISQCSSNWWDVVAEFPCFLVSIAVIQETVHGSRKNCGLSYGQIWERELLYRSGVRPFLQADKRWNSIGRKVSASLASPLDKDATLKIKAHEVADRGMENLEGLYGEDDQAIDGLIEWDCCFSPCVCVCVSVWFFATPPSVILSCCFAFLDWRSGWLRAVIDFQPVKLLMPGFEVRSEVCCSVVCWCNFQKRNDIPNTGNSRAVVWRSALRSFTHYPHQGVVQ